MENTKTETGIDISQYIKERDAGIITITKPIPASGNYFAIKAKFRAEIQNGAAVMIEDAPEVKNINRQSVADMRMNLIAQEVSIASIRAQLDAIEADMDLRDAGK